MSRNLEKEKKLAWGGVSVNVTTARLVLGGMMVAMSTALSFITLYHLPQGGSITLCSMLPVMLYAYLCGTKWGLAAGFVHGAIQLLIGLGDLKGISGATVAGSVALDYLLAFTVLGMAGIFRGRIKNDIAAFSLGAFLAGLLRYLCTFLSGWFLWSQYAYVGFAPELLQGTDGSTLACLYSLLYNGSYMIPEILFTCIAAFGVMLLAGKPLLKPWQEL